MIQDIGSKHLDNTFYNLMPQAEDFVIGFQDGRVFCTVEDGALQYPRYGQLTGVGTCTYLFAIDETRYFLEMGTLKAHGFDYHGLGILRKLGPRDRSYAGVTAYHLDQWYRTHRFCGACGHPTVFSTTERRIDCPECGCQTYPQIAPCIIVGVTNGDRLLLTRYAGRSYRRYALIAGFTEIGETSEDTVRREVWEEVGLRIKNIRFYKSQPWGYSSSLLMGYFAELDGDSTITLEEDELSEGVWLRPEEIEFEDDGISLTGEMIRKFMEEGKL